jgi:assimilatory nitrate reductase catalytic subunit
VHGSNLLVSAPDAHRVGERLAALDLLVVCDVVLSETAAVADVVLPVTQWAEEEGTMTTLEGRVVRRRRAVAPPSGVRTELQVWRELAARLGSTASFSDDAEAVFTELAVASAGGPADYSGIDYGRLDAGEALHWPCPATTSEAEPHPGTPRLFMDKFATPDGRARLVPVDHRPPDDDVRPEAPVHLVTGRVLQHYQSGAQTRQVPELLRAEPDGFVEIHPFLAARVGVEEGEQVRISSRRGSLVAPARITGSARPDTVFVPFHFAGPALVNAVTNDATDPVSGMPELKVCAVRLERVQS